MLIPRFETVLCDTDEARDYHYQLRYKVFCEETQFEDPDAFPDGRESDEYDDAATHFLIWDRLSRHWVGAMRLVDAKLTPLPSERICQTELTGLENARQRSVEFSRLAILKDSRRAPDASDFTLPERNGLACPETLPIYFSQEKNEVLLRLLWATFEWGLTNDIDYCYGIITAPLARLLKRFGVPLEVVGTEVRHRGVRRPHRYHVGEAKAGMGATLPEFAHLVEASPQPFVPFSKTRFKGTQRAHVTRAVTPMFRESRRTQIG